jgi:hypothetical protein
MASTRRSPARFSVAISVMNSLPQELFSQGAGLPDGAAKQRIAK